MTCRRKSIDLLSWVLPAVVLMVVSGLTGCTGGCSRDKDEAQKWIPPSEVTEQQVLDQPVKFEMQSIEEMAQMTNSGRTLSPTETAQAIVVAEAGANHLNQILEELVRNEDNADSWHVVTEMDQRAWPKNIMTIIHGLENQQLDTVQSERLATLFAAMERNYELINQLSKIVKNLPEPFQLEK